MDRKLKQFNSLLLEWNRVHNLTGAKTIKDIKSNIQDSIYPCKFIKRPTSILDIGTGAGFPGLILAVVYSDVKVTLCEPRNKRVSFLKFVVMELGLKNVTVVKQRVENLITTFPFGLITSRAVADSKILLNLTSHLRDKKTQYLFYKGRKLLYELKEIEQFIDYDIINRGERNYLYIRKVYYYDI